MVFDKSILFVYTMILFGFITGCFDIEAERTNPTDPENPNFNPRKTMNVAASDGFYTDKIIITWDAVKDAKKYIVSRSETEDSEFLKLAEIKTTMFEDINNEIGKKYYYQIVAYGLKYYWEPSVPDSGFRKTPKGTTISASRGLYSYIEVSYPAVQGADSYNIYRSTDEFGTYVKIGSSTSLVYKDTSALPAVYYYYKFAPNNTQLVSEGDQSTFSAKGIGIIEAKIPYADIPVRKIPAGVYEMGMANIAEPVHLVKFTRSFYLSKYEITWKQWRIVRDNARGMGFTLNDGYSGSLNNGDDTQPVVSVSWWDAVKWCNALSLINGKIPRYYTNNTFDNITKTSSGTDLVFIKSDANGYRLPTEAEWEYSCRANSNSIYFWGDAYTSDAINPYAWYYGNSVVSGVWKTNVIGLKNCNDYGLFDMAGNAREWCNDWYGTYLTDSQVDPVGVTSGTLTDRVVRGGYFRTSGSLLSSAERDAAIPSTVNTSYTFRICIEE